MRRKTTLKRQFFIGIDVGGTKISAALVSPSGEILTRVKYPTPKNASTRRILHLIFDTIHEILQRKNISTSHLAGIGVGVPGIVNNHGQIIAAPNIKLAGLFLDRELRKKFRTKAAAGNDVNLGILGEKWKGAARSTKTVLGIFPGTGIGGGVIADGKLLTGFNGAAGEIGHVIVDFNGPECGCGNRGCLEAFAGRWAIERDIKAAVKKGKKTLLKDFANGSWPIIKSKALAKALKKKDPLTVSVMKLAAEALGKGCVSLRHTFDPELIVLGGGLIEACGDFLVPIIQKIVDKDPFFKKLPRCKVVLSQLEDDAVILGAVALVKNS